MKMKVIKNALKMAKMQTREFGLIFTVKFWVYRYKRDYQKYIDNVSNILSPYLDRAIEETQSEIRDIKMPDIVPVWIFWWQGYENMPLVCKACFESVKRNLPNNAKLILITKDNYAEYVEISFEILDKINKQIYSLTTFSDLLRNMLLVQHGGIWIDSTIYCAHPIENDFLQEKDFWSIKLKRDESDHGSIGRIISQRMWGSFIQKNHPNARINTFVAKALQLYMEDHNGIAEYFTQNMFIKMLYERDEKVRLEIDSIPISNECVYDLADIINTQYNQEVYDKLVRNTTFFKLSWKKGYSQYVNGKETFFAMILKNCNLI